jgi:hypothetical protein
MPSTYSPNLRIQLIATGEQSGTWGTTTNTNLGTLIEDAIAGYVAVTVTTADQALTALNGAADQSRNMTIALSTTTSAEFNVYIPPAEKFYVIRNLSAYDAVIFCSTVLGNTTAAGTGVRIAAGTTFQVCSDGTNVYEAVNSFAGSLTVTGDLTVNGNATLGNPRLSATYSQTGTTLVTVTTSTAHGYTTGDVIQFIPTSGDSNGGSYTITVTGTTSFTFTNTARTTSGNAFVTNDTTTLNGVLEPGVVISSDTGTTYPALRITQVGTGNALVVEDEANPDSTPFVVDASGQVLVGSQTAITYASGVIPQLQVNKLGSEQVGISRFTNDTGGNALIFLKSRGTAFSNFDVVSSGDSLGTLAWYGADGTAGIQSATINATVDGTPTIIGGGPAIDMPSRLVFTTTAVGATSPTERMRIDNRGAVGIGNSTLTSTAFRLGTTITGATTAYGAFWGSVVQPDVTTQAEYHRTSVATAANGGTPYTVGSIFHYQAGQLTFNADSTVTNQYGFAAGLSLTGATNNYGFYSNIAAAAGDWNFYANGTATNYFAGDVGIGTNSVEAKLTVLSGTQFDPLLARTTTNLLARGAGTAGLGTYGGAVTFSQPASSRPWGAIAGVQTTADTDQGGLAFFVHGSSTTNDQLQEVMKITHAGNVGIGITPTEKLHVSGNILSTGSIDCGTQFLGVATDTATAPSFSFSGDGNTGVFRPGTDQVGITTGGTVRLTVTTAQFTGTLPWRGQNGTAAAPAFSASADTDTGIYFPAAGEIGLVTDGNERVRMGASGEARLYAGSIFTNYDQNSVTPAVQVTGGSQDNCSLGLLVWGTTATSEPNLILGKGYNTTPGTYTAIVSGQNMGQITFAASDGTAIRAGAGILAESTGTWSGSSRPTEMGLFVVAAGSTSATYLYLTPTGLTSQPTYDNTAAGSTVVVTSAGLIRRTSSSLKYKKDVETLDYSLASNAVENLRPVWYRTKTAAGDDKETWSHIGLIAEEVHEVEPRLVRYRTSTVTRVETPLLDGEGNPVLREDGSPEIKVERVETPLETPEPEDVDYGRLAVLLLAEVKSMKNEISILKAEIAALKGA